MKQKNIVQRGGHHTELEYLQAKSNKTWPSVVRTDLSPQLTEDEFCYLEDGYVHIFERHQNEGESILQGLGPCRYFYPELHPPDHGYTHGVDMFFFRGIANRKRQECFMECMDQIDFLASLSVRQANKILVQATVMGLPLVVQHILDSRPDVDPLRPIPFKKQFRHRKGLNAIQEAIRGGYPEIVGLLTQHDNRLVIDAQGRTVQDYVQMNGSPIRPIHAKSVLGIHTMKGKGKHTKRSLKHPVSSVNELGWSNYTSFEVEEECDIDIRYDDVTSDMFFHEYFLPGRPVLIRGQTPREEIAQFAKRRWKKTENYHPNNFFAVGPSAYPTHTGQQFCSEEMTITEAEHGMKCPEMPGIPMIRAWHPDRVDFDELFPIYNGNIYESARVRKAEEWFGPRDKDWVWQVFFGGDESGAAFHWHDSAVNILYVGIKEWRISPPLYRGWTGIPAKKSRDLFDDSVFMRCTQRPGDIMYIPENWGHTTVNHGFSIGAAAVLPPGYQKFAEEQRL